MRLLLGSVPMALFWVAAIRRWPTVREGWVEASLWATLVTLALALTIDLPPVVTALDDVVPNVMHVVKHALVLVATATVHETLRGLAMPPDLARRGWRRRAAGLAAVVAVLVCAFFVAPARQVRVHSLTEADVRHPAMLVYWAVYAGVLGSTLAAICVHQVRFVRNTTLSPLRTGMAMIGLGALTGLGYVVVKVAYVLVRAAEVRQGVVLEHAGTAEAVLLAVSGVLLVTGILWPAGRWGSRLGALRTWHALRRLRPMWAALADATPAIVLDGDRDRDRLRPVADLDARLYARVIEVRDGMLALRGYLPDGVDGAARREVAGAGIPAGDRDVVVRAVCLAAACRAKQAAGACAAPDRDGHLVHGAAADDVGFGATVDGPPDVADDLRELERIGAAWPLAERLAARIAVTEPVPAPAPGPADGADTDTASRRVPR